jgi:hypothetical protein
LFHKQISSANFTEETCLFHSQSAAKLMGS